MNELLLLLLPVAAASGWYAARRRAAQTDHVSGTTLSSDYFRGLNYLLNEQPDKAIEVFVKLMEVNPDTVEMHLAIGNLFRQRGEVDRAIRIHQNLVARTNLSHEQRSQSLLELAQDHMRAGLLDRAESLFQEFVSLNRRSARGLRYLLDIYQQEKDWDKAVATARALEEASGESLNREVAHFYCEQAEAALRDGQVGQAEKLAEKALATDVDAARASLLKARVAVGRGAWDDAIEALKQVEQQDPDFLPETLELLTTSCERSGNRTRLIAYLHEWLTDHGSVSVMLALADLISLEHGEEEAIEFISDQMRRRPSVRGLDRLIHLHLNHAPGDARENLMILKDLTTKLLDKEPVYRCHACGFSGRVLHWQCPSCKRWNTVKPIHGVAGD